MAEAQTKGVNFVNARAFVDGRDGERGWTIVLDKLEDEDRRTLESVVAVGWYSLSLYARLIRTIDQMHGAGDLSLLARLGRFEAERDLTTLHRIFFRLASPAFLLEKTASYWGRFHDTGRWTIERPSSTEAVGHLDGWGHVDEALCRELVGYLERAFELTGARRVHMAHPFCRAHHAPRCTFTARWT
jgi:hypothetical protein